MAIQLKDFICLFSHLPVQHFYSSFTKNQALHKWPWREIAVKQFKDAVLTGKRHLELPATSPKIPRKISNGMFQWYFPNWDQWQFVLTACMFNNITLIRSFCFTANFHCRRHILGQKSDTELAVTSTASSRWTLLVDRRKGEPRAHRQWRDYRSWGERERE